MTGTAAVRGFAAIASLALVAFLVIRVSDAAFTGSTANTGNDWTAGSVVLVDDDSGTAMFTVSGMVPGDSSTECLVVTYNGTVTPAAPVALSASIAASTDTDADAKGLEDDLTVSVDVSAAVSGGTFGDCTGFVDGGDVGPVGGDMETWIGGGPYSTAWTPTGAGQSRVFQFTVGLPGAAGNEAAGEGVTVDFTWSATS